MKYAWRKLRLQTKNLSANWNDPYRRTESTKVLLYALTHPGYLFSNNRVTPSSHFNQQLNNLNRNVKDELYDKALAYYG